MKNSFHLHFLLLSIACPIAFGCTANTDCTCTTVVTNTTCSCNAGYSGANSSGSNETIVAATTMCTPCNIGYYSTAGSSNCINCPAGTYGSTTKLTSAACSGAITCPAGKYAVPGATSNTLTNTSVCASCFAGLSSPAGSTSSSACTQCVAGTYSTAGTVCTNCPAGKSSSAGSTSSANCIDCIAGTYSTGNGGSCLPLTCPVGKYALPGATSNTLTDANVCASCSSGFSSPSGSTISSACTQCGAGKYSTAGTACTNCPAGTYGSTQGLTSATCTGTCVSGTFSSEGSLACPNLTTDVCTAGYFAKAGATADTLAGACTVCPIGTSKSAAGNTASCTTCELGKYQALTGQSSCNLCAAGSYGSTTGLTTSSCSGYLTCPVGKYALPGATSNNLSDATVCASCAPGYTSPSGSTSSGSCTICPAGKYSTGGSACIDCPAGTWGATTGLQTASCTGTCTLGSYAIAGSVSCTLCPVNTYGSSFGLQTSACTASCPSNTDSAAGSTACTDCKCKVDTFSDTGTATIIENSCNHANSSCYACISGSSTNGQKGQTSCGCLTNFVSATGGICQCPLGYYKTGTGSTATCTFCVEKTYNNVGVDQPSCIGTCQDGTNSNPTRTGCTNPSPSATVSSSATTSMSAKASLSPSVTTSVSSSPSTTTSPSSTVSSSSSSRASLSASTTVSSTASQSVSASASALPLNKALVIHTPSILTTNILFGPTQGRRLYLFGNNLTSRSAGNGMLYIEDVDYYKGIPDRAQSPVIITLSSSTMTCSQISSIAQLSLGIFAPEPFCSNPFFNLTSLWDSSLCTLSIVGRNRQDGSIIVPHNSVQFDYKELSSYLLCIEAQFSVSSVLTSNLNLNVAINITDMYSDPRQNNPIPVITKYVDCIKYYNSVSLTGGSILPLSKLSRNLSASNFASIYSENEYPILVFPPTLLTSISYVGSSIFPIMQARVTLSYPCSLSDILSFPSSSLQTFLSAGGDGRSFQLIGSSVCGGLIEIIGAGTAAEYRALLNSLTFSSSKGNDLPSSVIRNITVSTTTQASVRYSLAYQYFDDFLSSFISVIPINDPLVVPGGGSVAVANLSEGDAPQVQITITSNCSDEQVISGFSATYICLEDADPVIGPSNQRNTIAKAYSPRTFTQTSFYSISAINIEQTSSNSSVQFFFKSLGSEFLECSSIIRSSITNAYWSNLPTPCWRQTFLISSSPLSYLLNPLRTTFTLQILDTYRDDENITGSQTLNITSISLRVDLQEINKGGFPNIISIEGAPLPGLSVYGGDLIDIVGTGLGNKDSASPIVKLVGGFGLPSTFTGWELLNCKVITPARRLRCITPPGYGQSLQCTVNVYGNVSAPSIATISYARPFVLGIAPWNNVSALVSGTSSSLSVGLLNLSYLSVLSTGGTGLGSSQSLIGIEVTASGLPPMLSADAFNVSFVTGFNEMLSPRCLRPASTTHLLYCLIPPGASASLEVKVSVAGVSSRPLLVSFANPRITSVSTSITNGYLLTIIGENLGSDQSPGAPSLDRVELLADPLNSNLTNRCININYAPCLLKPHLALACSYVTAHTKIECALDPSSFGEFLSVRVIVAGLLSSWSEGTISYPPPLISYVSIVNTSTTTPGALVTRKGLACTGGTRILISGSGLSATGSQYFRLFIGGVPITYSFLTFIYSNTLSPSVISNAQAVVFSSVLGVQTAMPPGFGAVSIELFIGNRSTSYTVHYEPLRISSVLWRDGGLSTETRSANIAGTGMSLCALCLDKVMASTSDVDPDPVIFNNVATCKSLVPFGVPDIGCAIPNEFRSTVASLYNISDLTRPIGSVSTIDLKIVNSEGNTYPSGTKRIIPFGFSNDGSEGALKFTSDSDSKMIEGQLFLQFKGSVDSPAAFNFSFTSLLINVPIIKTVTPSPLDPPEPWKITLNKAGGNGGRVILREGKSSDSFFSIDCPTIWTTLVTRNILGKSIDSLPAWKYAKQLMSPTYYDSNPSSFASMKGSNVYLQLGENEFPPPSSCDCAGTSVETIITGIVRGRVIILTDSNRDCANCFVTFYNLQSRIYWVYASKAWMLYEKELPCYVTSWSGDITWSGNKGEDTITFVPPLWTGTTVLFINADGSESNEGSKEVSFAGPKVSSISPNTGSTRGDIITLIGSGFGLSESPLQAWSLMTNFSITSKAALGIKVPSVLDFYYNDSFIVVAYLSILNTITTTRRCSILSWSRTMITCRMPAGVPLSTNSLVVRVRDLGASGQSGYESLFISSSSAFPIQFKYVKPSPMTAQVAHDVEASTLGGYNVTIIGRNMGAFVDPFFSTPLSDIENKWTIKIRIQGARGAGLVNGLSISRDIEKSFVSSFTHESITFTLPSTLSDLPMIYEGKISIRVFYSDGVDSVCSNTDDSLCTMCDCAVLQISPPVITEIVPVKISPLKTVIFDADPCFALNVSTRGDNINETVSRGRGYQAGDTCMQEVREMGIYTSSNVNLKKPCFRSSATQSGKTQLYILGRNFGSGKSEVSTSQGITVGGVSCQAPSSAGETTVVNDSALLCSIQENLPRGYAEIIVTQAYQTVNSSLYGFSPMAMCACGLYSLFEGQECVPCPEGAICAGGSDKARAKRDYWETIPSEWKSARFIVLTIPLLNPNSPVKPFVPCIERGMCGSDNNCLGNSTGWMCTSCIVGSNGEEMRRADDGISCEICSTEMTNVVFPASIGSAGSIVFLLVCLYIVSIVWCKRKASKLDEKAKEQMARWEQEEKMNDLKAPLGVYVRITVSFMQTLGAMSLYVQPSKKSAFSAEEPSPYLVFLKSFKFVNDIGTNLHAIQCQLPSGASSYDLKLWAFMFLPVIVVAVFVSISVIYEMAIELTSWLKKEDIDENGQKVPRVHRTLSEAIRDGSNNGAMWSSQLVVFALPTSISAAARAQDCSDISTGTYLKEFPIHSCSDEDFKRLQLIAWYMGLLWLLIPLLIAIILYSGPNALLFLKPIYGSKWNGTSFLSIFQFAWGDEVPNEVVTKLWEGIDLANPIGMQIVLNPGDKAPTVAKNGVEREEKVAYFRADVWKSLNRTQKVRFGWEMIVILRKSVLMGIATGFAGVKNLISQILFTIIILQTFLVIHLRLDPYKYRRINYLDTIAYLSEICGCIYVSWHLSAYQPADVTTVKEAQSAQSALSTDFYAFSYLAVASVILYVLLLLFFILDSIGVFYCCSRKKKNDNQKNEHAKQLRSYRNSSNKFRIKNLKAPFDDGVLHQFPTSQLAKLSKIEKSLTPSKKGVKKLGVDEDGKEIVLELDTRFLDKNNEVIAVGDVVFTVKDNREARVVNLLIKDSIPVAEVSFMSEVARKYDPLDTLRGKRLNPDTLLTEEEVLARLKSSAGQDSFDVTNPMYSMRRLGRMESMRVVSVDSDARAQSIERDKNEGDKGRIDEYYDEEYDINHTYPSPRHFNNEEEEDEEDENYVDSVDDDSVERHRNRRLRNINDDDEEVDGEEGTQERVQRFRAQPRAWSGWALTGGLF
jgi:hypothetical protein